MRVKSIHRYTLPSPFPFLPLAIFAFRLLLFLPRLQLSLSHSRQCTCFRLFYSLFLISHLRTYEQKYSSPFLPFFLSPPSSSFNLSLSSSLFLKVFFFLLLPFSLHPSLPFASLCFFLFLFLSSFHELLVAIQLLHPFPFLSFVISFSFFTI